MVREVEGEDRVEYEWKKKGDNSRDVSTVLFERQLRPDQTPTARRAW